MNGAAPRFGAGVGSMGNVFGATKARILVVDDHPIVQEGLAQLLNREADITVAWQAARGEEAIAICQKEAPDLAVVDITLKNESGIEVIRALLACRPGLPILVMSMHDEALYAERVLRAGARGYVMKQVAPKQVVTAIRTVLRGQVYVNLPDSGRLSEQGAQRVVPHASDGATANARPSEISTLSDRELQVFQLVAAGLAKRAIAARLGLSVNTVETHRKGIKRKLGVASSSELARLAFLHQQLGA